ncbi:MAG: hypothetical protein NVSMB39_7340 [Candidatus Saccharimonadales bacterium]
MSGEMIPAGAFEGVLPEGVRRYCESAAEYTRGDSMSCIVEVYLLHEERFPNRIRCRIRGRYFVALCPVSEHILDYSLMFDAVCLQAETVSPEGNRFFVGKKNTGRYLCLELPDLRLGGAVAMRYDPLYEFMVQVETAQLLSSF